MPGLIIALLGLRTLPALPTVSAQASADDLRQFRSPRLWSRYLVSLLTSDGLLPARGPRGQEPPGLFSVLLPRRDVSFPTLSTEFCACLLPLSILAGREAARPRKAGHVS